MAAEDAGHAKHEARKAIQLGTRPASTASSGTVAFLASIGLRIMLKNWEQIDRADLKIVTEKTEAASPARRGDDDGRARGPHPRRLIGRRRRRPHPKQAQKGAPFSAMRQHLRVACPGFGRARRRAGGTWRATSSKDTVPSPFGVGHVADLGQRLFRRGLAVARQEVEAALYSKIAHRCPAPGGVGVSNARRNAAVEDV